ncbi:MAG: FxSxx-COOH system tetratricopeptide repeat protein [Actinomycetota bacterium]|nr:FxSxx-COOH system tetratricopeptide repeat protein [Actinomycetota bacterium]
MSGSVIGDAGAGHAVAPVFVSHTGRDTGWAEWAAWQLEAVGHVVELDAWDWAAGDKFVLKMRDALERCEVVLALFSQAYFDEDRYTTEWTASVRHGGARLVPVRIEPVTPPRLLDPPLARDLFGVPEDRARRVLLEAVAGPPRPGTAPAFPPPVRGGPRLPGALPPVWSVPRRTPAFTGRDAMLTRLRQQLAGGGPVVVQALHGMGGVGKSALATEYAHRYSADYELVWWIDAGQVTLIGGQLAAVAIRIGIAAPGTPEPEAVAAIRTYLATCPGWLVIFDNAEDPAELVPWLPDGPGHLLVTSRSPNWRHIAAPLPIDVFARSESVRLLTSYLPSLSAEQADQLAQALGDLPLALTQAAGLIAESALPVPDYLRELDGQATETLAEKSPVGYPRPLATTVGITLDRYRTEDPGAHALISFCAFLGPEPIPIRLFAGADPDRLPEPLRRVRASPLALRHSLGRLARYGTATVTESCITVHRLTQAVIRDHTHSANGQPDHTYCAAARDALAKALDALSADLPSDWTAFQELLPHLQAIVDSNRSPGCTPAADSCGSWIDAASRAVHYLSWAGNAAAAVSLGTAILDHADVESELPAALQLRFWVAWTVGELGRWVEAEALLGEVHDIQVRVLGADHPDTLDTRHALAQAVGELGRWVEVEALLGEVYDAEVRVLGAEHPSTLTTRYRLAQAVGELGRWVEVEALLGEVYDAEVRVLGAEHPSTLVTRDRLVDAGIRVRDTVADG